ncbi:MAG: restriction endonuclease subunit S [Pseudanabaena sp.]
MNNYQLSIKNYQLYKDSGVEWLGDVPEHWEVRRIQDLAYKIGDGLHGTPNYIDSSDFYFINGNNLIDGKIFIFESTKCISEDEFLKYTKKIGKNSILLSVNGTIGNLAFYNNESVVLGKSAAYIDLKNNINKQYVYYFLQSTKVNNFFETTYAGTTIKNLSLRTIKLTSILNPPLSEQKSIATYLDTKTAQCDRKIDLLTQKATQYGKLKQSLINETVTRGLDKSVPMKDSAIGEIPEHWEVKRLKDLSDIQNSNVDKKSYDDEIPVKLCNYVDVYKNEFIDSSLNFMEATATKSEIKQFTIKKGDVFITKDSETCDDIAIPALATESLDGVLCGYHLARFRMKEKIFLGSYLFRLFQSKSYGFRFVISAKGITRVGLGQSAIADSLTPVPPLSEQKAIADYLDKKTAQIDQIIQTINTQLEKLKELRKTLINDVVTGKIKVINN